MDVEYQTHFVLWAMMGSPLIIGCDIRAMSNQTKALLTSNDIIAIRLLSVEAATNCPPIPTRMRLSWSSTNVIKLRNSIKMFLDFGKTTDFWLHFGLEQDVSHQDFGYTPLKARGV